MAQHFVLRPITLVIHDQSLTFCDLAQLWRLIKTWTGCHEKMLRPPIFVYFWIWNPIFALRSHFRDFKGSKIASFGQFQVNSGPLVILESWAYPYELPSTALCEVPRLSIPPYVVDISKPSMKEFAKYDVLYYFSSIFRIFSEKFSQNRSDVSTKSKRRLDGSLGRFRLKIECRLRWNYFQVPKTSANAWILTVLKGI